MQWRCPRRAAPQKSREETAGKASLSGSAFDFLADFADALADFVNGIVHSGTGALGWASGSGAANKNNRCENEKKWFHRGL